MKFLERIPADVRFRMSRMVVDSPLAGPYMRAREPYQHVRYVNACDLVIDGFPRSANTYAWYASKLTLEPKYMVRGHTHVVETLRRGLQNGKPTMLLLREPDAAVASLYQMRNGVSLRACFDAYTRFHRKCLTLGGELYVARFDQVTNDFGAVLKEFYKFNGVDWPVYEKTALNESRVFDIIDSANQKLNDGSLREQGVARPSSKRTGKDEVLASMSKDEKRAQAQAKNAYSALIEK